MSGKRIWYSYTETARGFLPKVAARLIIDGHLSSPISFIVDTGACQTLIGTSFIKRALRALNFAPDPRTLINTGLVNATGGDIKGFPIRAMVQISGFPELEEDVVIVPDSPHALLGQRSFLEHFGGHFHNFAASHKGRKFALLQPQFSDSVRRYP